MVANAEAGPEAISFLVLLERAEQTVQSFGVGHSGDADPDMDQEFQAELWRAKIVGYQITLRELLVNWRTLAEPASERYERRIQDLPLLLEAAVARRRTEAKERAAADAGPDSSKAPLATPETQAPEPEALPTKVQATVSAPADSQATVSAPADAQATAADPSLAWRSRRPTRRTQSEQAEAAKKMKGQMEDEMINLAESMKQHAQSFKSTLSKDNAMLEGIHDKQNKALDQVTAETKKGKDLLWSSQLSFFKTMIMLAVNLVIFFMMLPFIFWT